MRSLTMHTNEGANLNCYKNERLLLDETLTLMNLFNSYFPKLPTITHDS